MERVNVNKKVPNIDSRYLASLRTKKKESDHPVKRGAYIRISDRERAMKGYGIDSQVDNIVKHYRVMGVDPKDVKFYIDDGYSGKSLKRPKMQEMLQDVLDGNINEIIIYKLDRIARNVIDVYELLQLFIDQECELTAIVDNLDIHSANGRMLVGILAIIAQWEREIILERTEDAYIEMCLEGKYPFSNPPYGYRIKDKKLCIYEPEAKIFRYICKKICQGYTVKEVERLTKLKYPDFTKRPDKIKKMVKKIFYIGQFEYQGQLYLNIVPALITNEIYDQVQQMLQKRHIERKDNHYLFSNKIVCTCGEICERKSTKKKNKRYYYYVCPVCKKRINQEKILDLILARVYAKASTMKKYSQVKIIERRLKHLDQKMNEAFKQYTNANIIDVKTYASIITKLNLEQQELEKRLALITRAKTKDGERSLWNKMTVKEKAIYVEEYIKRITIDLELQLVVHLEFNDD